MHQQKFSNKLAFLDSSNSCEIMNMIISKKARKDVHYSGSESLNFRVASAVVQKNEGHGYVSQVNERLGLSPGKFSVARAFKLDKRQERRYKKQLTVETKKRRLRLKEERSLDSTATAVCEGDTHKTSVGLTTEPADTEPIPRPDSLDDHFWRESIPLLHTTVAFDVDTTGSEDEIVQIFATCTTGGDGKKTFDQYIFPTGQFSLQAARITKLTMINGNLYLDDKAVKSLSKEEGIKSFLQWLGNFQNVVLLAHNCTFDSRMLVKHCYDLGLLEDLAKCVYCFTDSLPIMKEVFPDRKENGKSYKQESLAGDLLQKRYDAHNAPADVEVLLELFNHPQVSKRTRLLKDHSFSVDSALNKLRMLMNKKLNRPSLQCLVDGRAISDNKAKKIAAAGLRLRHLKLAVRVTNRPNIVRKIYEGVVENIT